MSQWGILNHRSRGPKGEDGAPAPGPKQLESITSPTGDVVGQFGTLNGSLFYWSGTQWRRITPVFTGQAF
jgi:hypothetical protein